MNDPHASGTSEGGGEAFHRFAGRLDDALFCKDTECRLTYANDSALRAVDLFGGAHAIGHRLSELCPTPDADRIERHDRAVIMSGETSVVNENFVAAGYARGYLVTRVPLRCADGEVCGLACLWVERRAASGVDDVRDQAHSQLERKHLLAAERAERQRAEFATRARDQLLGIVSHDLRSPLNGIQSWANVLETQLPPDASPITKRALDGIKSGVEQQVRLIEDLLDATRILSGRVNLSNVSVPFLPIVRSAVEGAETDATAREIRIVTELEGTDQSVQGDPERLRQIVAHLLSNAVRHAPARSDVGVRLDRVGNRLRLGVTDRGKSAAPGSASSVFEWFRHEEMASARSQAAFGLELALARHLTELHGGTVSVNSAGTEQGVTFEVQLPLAEPPVRNADPSRGDIANDDTPPVP